MDQVYHADLPRQRKALVALQRQFAQVSAPTDWAALRVAPLLDHVRSLERLLRSAKFARETARLRTGVVMFHADLVYLRANVRALREILAVELRRAQARKARKAKATARRKRPGPARGRPAGNAVPAA